MIAKLIVASGKSAGRAIAIKRNKLLIGRAEECDVRPLSEEVSRRHCGIAVGPAEVWIEDLGSRNGTFVNGSRITARTRLAHGDIVRVGSLELKLECQAPAQPFTGSDDDVSRLLMADDEPAGMSDTTRSLASVADPSSIDGRDDGGPAASPPGAAPPGTATDGPPGSGGTEAAVEPPTDSSRSAIEALKAAKAKPGGLPQASKKPAADSSRDAAADALRKFFERK